MLALVGLIMATLVLVAVLTLMVSWASQAHLVPVLVGQLMFALTSVAYLVPALTIRPAATSALAAVLWLVTTEGVQAAWWHAVVHAAW